MRGSPPASGRDDRLRLRSAAQDGVGHRSAASGSRGRVRILDFTSYMCDANKCPSVIGGVLVRKDGSHLTRAFADLGPFVLRAVS